MDGSPLAARSRLRALVAFACLASISALAVLSSFGTATGRADDVSASDAIPGQLVVG